MYFRWTGWELLGYERRCSEGVGSGIYTWRQWGDAQRFVRAVPLLVLCQFERSMSISVCSGLEAPVSVQVEMLGCAVDNGEGVKRCMGTQVSRQVTP